MRCGAVRCGAVALIVVPLRAPPQLCHDGEDLLDLVTTHEVRCASDIL